MSEGAALQQSSAEREAVFSQDRSPSYRPDIEGMRAVAILMVVGFHAGIPWLRGGFVGVDVFFVLSGYLITELLAVEIERTGSLGFRRFYSRRVKRLLPASLAMVICTLMAAMAVLAPLEVVTVGKTGIATVSYASNLWFMLKSTDYFGPGIATNPLLHTWSLAVEEQFYLVWPLVLFLCMRRRRSRVAAAVVLSGLALLSFAACIWFTRALQPVAFFSSPTRTWEFAFGGIAVLLQHTRWFGILRREAAAWIGAALVLLAAVWLHPEGFPGTVALVPVLGTVLILVSCKYSVSSGGIAGLLKRPLSQRLGKLSYSWYLWHWPVLVFGRIIFPGLGMLTGLSLLAASLALAWLSYRLIENPIRFSRKLAGAPTYALALGAGMTAAGLLISGVVFHLAKVSANSVQQREFLTATAKVPEEDRCMTNFRSSELKTCSLGRGDGQTVVLFGDSHAEQWLPALKAAQFSNWHIVPLLKAACPSVTVPVYNPHLQRIEDECSQWRAKAIKYIQSEKPAAVLICNSSGYVKRTSGQDGYATLTLAQWQQGMRKTLEDLNTGSTSILVVRDTPRPGVDIPTCLARAKAHPALFSQKGCVVREDKATTEAVWKAEQNAASGLTHVVASDLTDHFCREGECRPILNKTVVYRDDNHMTAGFSASLAPVLADQIQMTSLPGSHK